MLALDYQLPSPENNFDFNVTFKPISSQLRSYKEEIITTAKYVHSIAHKPLYLAYSGGIDSEIIADSFLYCGIPFTAITFRYPDNVNGYDINYAYKFCHKNSIPHLVVDIDPISIYEKALMEGGKTFFNWWNYVQIYMIEYIDNIGGCAILGTGLRENPLKTINGNISLNFSTGYFNKNEWCKEKGSLHFPYFFQARPEVYAAYLQDPLIAHLLTEPNYFKNRTFSSLEFNPMMDEYSYALVEKLLISYKFWPDLERRPKYDGLEKLRHTLLSLENLYRGGNSPQKILTKTISEIKKELGI